MKVSIAILSASVISMAIMGCGSSSSDTAIAEMTPVSFDTSKYVLTDEPDGAVGVIEARGSAKDGDAIVVVGRIGGAANPWIEGRSAFTLLDASKAVVANGTNSKKDEICLGDCCAIERSASTALVTVVDENGKVLSVDSRKLFTVAQNDMVVVSGKAKVDESGNFVVVATGVYVRR